MYLSLFYIFPIPKLSDVTSKFEVVATFVIFNILVQIFLSHRTSDIYLQSFRHIVSCIQHLKSTANAILMMANKKKNFLRCYVVWWAGTNHFYPDDGGSSFFQRLYNVSS
jgi:hypothetical protein